MYVYVSYIAEYSYKGLVSGGNDKCDDIQVENYGSQYNNIVEIWAGQTNQPEVDITSYIARSTRLSMYNNSLLVSEYQCECETCKSKHNPSSSKNHMHHSQTY